MATFASTLAFVAQRSKDGYYGQSQCRQQITAAPGSTRLEYIFYIQ